MDDRLHTRSQGGPARERHLGIGRSALVGLYLVVGFVWAAIPVSGGMTAAGNALFWGVALVCFAAALSVYTFRRWAAVVAILALLGSVGLFLALRAAFSSYPF